MSANTELRLSLAAGGTIEVVSTPGVPGVVIFVDSTRCGIALDVTAAEAFDLAHALAKTSTISAATT